MWRQYHQPGSLLPSASLIGQDHDTILQNLKEHIYNYFFSVTFREVWEAQMEADSMFMSLTLMLHRRGYANFISEQVIENVKKGREPFFCR